MKNETDNPHGGDPEVIAKVLGLEAAPKVNLDFSVNLNPAGAPDSITAALSPANHGIEQYPEIYADTAAGALAEAHGIKPEMLTIGNGSTEIMSWIIQALKPEKIGWVPPCYAGYEEICRALSADGSEIDASNDDLSLSFEKLSAADHDLIFLASPNNPTGALLERGDIISFSSKHPEKTIVIDESFIDFIDNAVDTTLISEDIPANVIVVKSLTKFFAIPGLRLGLACASQETISKINRVRLPWSVNSIAQKAAVDLYTDGEYISQSRKLIAEYRENMISALSALPGYEPLPSSANFILVRLPAETTASRLQADLLSKGILIRSCANYSGLGEQYIRLAVRPCDEVRQLISAIKSEQAAAETKRADAIMVVGTTSDSGKSVTAAGLCRYFKRQGIKAAPFKAQNMALNSFVTPEGGEMGRAQVVQAEACGIDPHTDMNPVLLKPTGDTGSQVIVNGKAIGNYTATDYYAVKDNMRKYAHEAYDRLASKYDLIVLEGAGSPAEINLLKEDFVNMDMAQYADADVILVADIDRGGVFASIYGTINLIPAEYHKLIKGVIINKFRGDVSLLEPGIKQIEKMTGIPVLGVLPYVRNLNIEDEDSLGLQKRDQQKSSIVDIAVIRLPRISNYTDFIPLENVAEISLRYVSSVSELGTPDLVIIPGTKNTRADLQFMHEEGFVDELMDMADRDIPIFGICGGYQMLGNRISDPTGVEGTSGEDIGLNLLPLSTILEPKKELSQVEGYVEQSLPFARPQTPFSGYEIHAGRTSSAVFIDSPLIITKRLSEDTSTAAGSISENGLVFGCYIHGLFDSEPLREQILNWLCERKGINHPKWTVCETQEQSFDMLANLISDNINLSLLNIY